jgi:N-hydroxyarylamine O-acetyltransferase
MNYPLLTSDELARYFHRIGYQSNPGANLQTLQQLHRRHPQAIAFENLDSWCGHTPSLAPDKVFDKLVCRRRGGYCFEQNQLLLRVLLSLGFRVHTLAARVLLPDRHMPRTHKVLLVEIGKSQWLADVGFGGMTMTAPLELQHAAPQTTPHESWRLQPVDDEFEVSAWVDAAWSPKFRFALTRQIAEDYEMANWVVANHPASRFRHELIAARPDSTGRYALLNTRLSYHHQGQPSRHSDLQSPADVLHSLQQVFGIDTQGVDGLEQRIARLFTPS